MFFAWAAFWVALIFGLMARELSFRAMTVLVGLWVAGFIAMVCFGAFANIGNDEPAGAAFGFGVAFHAILAVVAFLMAFKGDVRIR